MATYTLNYLFTQPTVASQAEANLWGNYLNTDAAMVDEVLGKTLALSGLTNANVTLTYAQGTSGLQANCAHYVCTGTLTGNVIVYFPAGLGRTFSIQNATTGAFTLSVACTGGGAALVIPQGSTMSVVSDGNVCSPRVTAGAFGALLAANNLSDLNNVATARTNLGVTATGADTAYAFRANNLSDLASASAARGNLGLGALSTLGVGTGLTSGGGNLSVSYGTGVGTAAQGNDLRITGAVQAANNGSDFANKTTTFVTLGAAVPTHAQQSYYGTVSGGVLTQRSATGGITVSRTGSGAYTITLGSTALNMGAVLISVYQVGLGDGQNALPTSTGPYAANGSVPFVVRNNSSKSQADPTDIIILVY